ncbi:MAG: hypothetical protein M0R49_04290 [Limnochordia bacterium]|jgi:hypothetical protein|nr:hypothetical protein [Limnochordia bacterium]
MLKTPRTLVTVLILLVSLTVPVSASRILVVPTADVADNMLELDFLYHRGLSSLQAQFGFYRGLSGGLRQDFADDSQLYVTFRAALIEETQTLPGFALGGELSLGRQHLYAVASKQLGIPGLRGHLALGLGRYSRGMAAVSFMLNPVKVTNVPTTSVFVEYDGQGINGGLVTQFSPELKASIGLSSGHGMSFGLGYKAAF